MRIIAIDFGQKRIGLAVGDSDVRLPSPLPSLIASGSLAKDAAAVAQTAKANGAVHAAVGFPAMGGHSGGSASTVPNGENVPNGGNVPSGGIVPSDGGKMQRICRRFAEELRKAGLTADLVDEAMTSEEALSELRQAGLDAAGRKRSKDALSAILIFERFVTNGPFQD